MTLPYLELMSLSNLIWLIQYCYCWLFILSYSSVRLLQNIFYTIISFSIWGYTRSYNNDKKEFEDICVIKALAAMSWFITQPSWTLEGYVLFHGKWVTKVMYKIWQIHKQQLNWKTAKSKTQPCLIWTLTQYLGSDERRILSPVHRFRSRTFPPRDWRKECCLNWTWTDESIFIK